MEKFFKDLKIIELANVLAGPAVGMFFAELGAEVIKIENQLTNGDVTRTWKLAKEDPNSNTSAYFASVNRNKKSIFLDLRNNKAKETVYELLSTSDIVIVNYKPGDDVKLGMDYNTIKKINPKIIYAHITGFGFDNKRTAYDLVLQAETGFMFMNGNKTSGPLKMPVALIDILAAHQLKEGILVALIKLMRTGTGSMVSVSLYDAAIASLANQASNWLMTGIDPQPLGSLHPNIAPYGEIFESSDKQMIVLAIGNDKQFKNLCDILKCQELISDERFLNNRERVKYRNELFKLINTKFKECKAHDLMRSFIEADVPAGIIKPLSEVFEDPSAKDLVTTEEIKGQKNINVRTAVFKLQ
jgi:crotonobetainyl-CoA:carnitine CoA-transferase CaiB-like acyl-CoA transferase